MSATRTVMCPSWCTVAECDSAHLGPPTTVKVQGSEIHAELRLLQFDDDPRDGAYVRLNLSNAALVVDHFDADLTVEDAAVLGHALLRQADALAKVMAEDLIEGVA